MLIAETSAGIAARQAEVREDSPEAAEPMRVSQGQLPAFLAEALESMRQNVGM